MFTCNTITAQSFLNKVVSTFAFTMCVVCILWNLSVPTRLGFSLLTEQYLAFQLGLALSMTFLFFDFKGKRKTKVNILDLTTAMIGFMTLMYASVDFADLLSNASYRPPEITVIGTVVVLLVLEGVRRIVGKALFIITLTFVIYALFADKVTGPLEGKALSVVNLVQYIGFDPSAVFSTPLAVGTIIVLLFLIFGGLLFAAGGGDFFTDLAMAAAGKSRGGSAKIAVVSSALFGTISGSAVANVATIGIVTIPLMERTGYSKTDSAAIESIASTGGQLTPPIMGAAAFLMAEYLNVSYMTIAAAAMLPALFYYLSVYIQIHLMAGRDNIVNIEEGLLSTREVFKEGWHFILPFAVLLGTLFFLDYSPQNSAMLASLAIIAVGTFRSYRGRTLNLIRLRNVFIDTGIVMVDLVLILAAAGFIIGVLNVTGLGFAITLLLVDTIGSNFVLLLFASAVICIFLGMGMPTSGVYILLATLVVPSLIEGGASPIAAHMFILYFGMMSMITPPVALAAFAAAAIAKADAIATGFAAMRIGWANFVIPFLFISTPTLLLEGSLLHISIDVVKTIIGMGMIGVGIVGYFESRINIITRIAFILIGLGCFPLAMLHSNYWDNMNIVCCIISVIVAILMMVKARKTQKLDVVER